MIEYRLQEKRLWAIKYLALYSLNKRKTMFKIFILCTMLMGVSMGKEFGTCTSNNDAMTMMIAAQVHIQKLKNAHAYEELADYMNVFAETGRIINKKNYQEACDVFMETAKEYGFDIEEAYKTVIPVEALNNIPKKGQCGVKEAAVAFMFFTEEVLKKKLIKHKAYKKLSKEAGLHSIQNPNLLCQNIKSVSKEFNISYENIMKRVDEHLIVRNKEIKERKKHIAKNESTNKNCSQNDAVELYLKNQDFNKKFTLLRDKWKRREDTASNARLYNSARIKSIRKRKKEVGVVISDLSYDFQEEVKVHITDNGMYDKACKNYKKLEATYMKKLLNLRDIYNQFDNKKRETNEKNII
jgi:hypothetical protein